MNKTSIFTPKLIIGFFFLIAIMITVYCYDPSSYQIYPPCIFHFLTKLYCPGCGCLRSVYQLLHGNLAKAFSHNILIQIYMPILIAYFLEECGLKGMSKILERKVVRLAVIGIVLVFFIFRNIPTNPFLMLSP